MSQELTWDTLVKRLDWYEKELPSLRQQVRILEDIRNQNNHESFHRDAYVEQLHQWLKSDAVYYLLRRADLHPEIITGDRESFRGLFEVVSQLRAADEADLQNREDNFNSLLP